MRRLLLSAFALCLSFFAHAPAQAADNTRSWVSNTGDDANSCSSFAPCASFSAALAKTVPKGEINCLGSGSYGPLTIQKSITINCEGALAGIVSAGGTAILILAGATDRVHLKGLDIDGVGAGSVGIRIDSAGYVQIEDCNIRGFGDFSAIGIQIAPTSNFSFAISRTSVFANGKNAAGGGIQIRPTGGSTLGTMDHVLVNRNAYGIAVDGSGGANGINIAVVDSVISNNTQVGIYAYAPSTGAGIRVARTTVLNNTTGIAGNGANSIIRVRASSIVGNGTGVSGNVQSFQDNDVANNGVDGTMAAVPGGLK